MKVLTVERDTGYRRRHKIYVSDASILVKHADSTAVVLAVDGTLHAPNADYLRDPSDKDNNYDDRPRCAGVIEATDQELEILAGAGYQLVDLRNAGVSEVIKAL